jgi:hypothetical protein
LEALTVRQGAGRFNLDFSAPNPEYMSLLEVSYGAAGIELENLSNANFSKMRLSGEAAGYELDFGGVLKRDAEVIMETGLSAVEIAVPGSIAAKIVAETTLGTVDVGDGFTKREAVLDRTRHGREEAALDDPRRSEVGSPSDGQLERNEMYNHVKDDVRYITSASGCPKSPGNPSAERTCDDSDG